MTSSNDRDQIVETVTRMAVLADGRRWAELGRIFADEIRLDYTAMLGGDPAVATRDGLVAAWTQTLGALAATQHILANHIVSIDGDRAVVTATFQATHVPNRPDERRWVLGGDYRFELARDLDGWLIDAVTMTPRWETGDRTIVFSA